MCIRHIVIVATSHLILLDMQPISAAGHTDHVHGCCSTICNVSPCWSCTLQISLLAAPDLDFNLTLTAGRQTGAKNKLWMCRLHKGTTKCGVGTVFLLEPLSYVKKNIVFHSLAKYVLNIGDYLQVALE